jgi:flagellar hook-associated protein 2
VIELSISRLTGFATGMDTDSIVKKLMDAERIPLNRLKQNQQRQIWLIDSYRQWNTDLLSFRNNTLFNMNLSGTYNTSDVGISMTNSITGTASSSAIAGTYSISIRQLAESASLTGSKVKLDTTKTLGNTVQGARQLTTNTSISINVYNDSTNPSISQTANIAINTTDTINDVISRINSATDSSGKSLGLQANYDSNLQQFIVKTKATGETTKIDFTSTSDVGKAFLSNTLGLGTNATISGETVNNLKITAGNNDKLTMDLGGLISTITLTERTYNNPQELVDEINLQIGNDSKLATNVNATVDDNGKVTLTSLATGTQSSITVSGTGAAAIGFLATSSFGTDEPLIASGKNADVIFNGQQINILTSNNVTLMGINLTLKSPTQDSNGNILTSTITVSKNVDTVLKNIKDFVGKYNELLEKMSKITTEAVYRDYLPLLDEQRNEMTEKQVEQWEAKAKSGLFRGDSIMTDLVNKMRQEMSSSISNGSPFTSLAAIGISSKSYQDRGKLYIDETKLRDALQIDPEGVEKLFSQIGDSSNGTSSGLIGRLSDVMLQGVRNLTTKAGLMGNSQYDQSTIGRALTRIQTDITRQNQKLLNKESQYYRQFAAMESAVAKFNSQSSWLYQQSGGQY